MDSHGILGPVSYFDFVCDRLCFFVYTVVEQKFICPNVSSSNVWRQHYVSYCFYKS